MADEGRDYKYASAEAMYSTSGGVEDIEHADLDTSAALVLGSGSDMFDSFKNEQATMRAQEKEIVEARIRKLKTDQENRRVKWEEEDNVQLKRLEHEMAQRRAARAKVEERRTRQLYEIQMKLASEKAEDAERDALEKHAALVREKTGELCKMPIYRPS